jgi:predicted MFS family arabinose efflux permease
VFAWYNVAGGFAGALGALAAGLPERLVRPWSDAPGAAGALAFAGYAAIGVALALLYRGTTLPPMPRRAADVAPLARSRGIVFRLTALFSLDAFGGGFVVQSMLALWLHQRFDVSMATAGVVFFWTGVLTAASYLVAVRIAGRFGLLNTMVFTHLPSSVCLILVPFAPNLGYAIALLFVRSALSQMDVPTRSSYVMAIVTPEERAAAASITSVPRSLASAVSPFISGYLMGVSTFGWPLVVAGGVKILYDILLLTKFRKIRPPEEIDRI